MYKVASTFSITSKKYDGRYLQLDLTQTRNESANTSTVLWKLTAVAGDVNYYSTGPTTAKLGNTQLCYYGRKSYTGEAFPTGPRGESRSGTVTVKHDDDGTLSLPVSLTTAIYNTSTSTASGTWTLDANKVVSEVYTPSSITGAGNTVLGSACSVQWTPGRASYRYKLQFSIGTWSHTTGVIHPNKTSSYIYSGYTLPLEAAKQITKNRTGTMTVKLTTYTDSACACEIGSDSETFKVTVPDNGSTQPAVSMTLKAVDTLNGIYVQGISKVQATLNATGKYGTSIVSYALTAEDKTYSSPFLTNSLQETGEVVITGTATDQRGLVGAAEQTVTVIPYFRPKLTGVKAYRCDAQGKAADNGKYLKIQATRSYAPVKADGQQNNFCKVQYRYRAENATNYGAYTTILAEDAAGDTVTTSALLNGKLDTVSSYAVEISAVDTLGRKATPVTVRIPGEAVYRHKRAGGKGMGLGGYCEKDNLLDVHWNQRVRKNMNVDGNMDCGGDLTASGSVAGVWIKVTDVRSVNTFTVQSRFETFDDQGHSRQMILVFGCDNNVPINGVAILRSNGNAEWKGEGDVAVSAGAAGQFVFTLPVTAYDAFTLISPYKFSIVQEG